jgi:TRAP-type mannitol/chloroaromatic compound transport system substrate-binding protein
VHDEAAGEFAMMNARALKTLTEEHGVEMVRLPDEVLRAAAEASRDVLQRTAQRDEMSRRIHDSFRKALIQLSAWSRVGDEAFLDARRRYALAD